MKKTIIIFLVSLLAASGSLFAQGDNAKYSVAGTVMDEKGEPIAGATITLQSDNTVGVVTDADGRFQLKGLSSGDKLIFRFLGYVTNEYEVYRTIEKEKVVMVEDVGKLNELVVMGRSSQRKISVVGAMSTVTVKELSAPSTSISNMLGGRVAGIIAVSRTGEPGKDFSEFWVRGISTFGAGASALVLIDGIEGNINDVNVSDIESFSVLKDASATAVYGVRGANGVVIITTNRGKAGKISVNYKGNVSYSESARTPNYLGSKDYAMLANEARVVRGKDRLYTDVEIDLYASGLDPDLYPDVNWRDEIMNKGTYNKENYLSVSGGGDQARYFLSASAISKDALFKQDKSANKYNTNINYKQYTFRANVDANVTKTTIVSMDLSQVIILNKMPGYGDGGDNQSLWDSQANLTPVTVPVRYSDGRLPAFGSAGNQISPYVLLNHTGYRERNRSSSKLNVGLHQNLDIVTKGLAVHGLFSFNSDSYHNIYRRKMPDLYYATGRNLFGELQTKRTVERQDPSYSRTAAYHRKFYTEFKADYNRTFGDHGVTGLVHYYMEDYKASDAQNDIDAIPKRYQALSMRATYSFRDTYLFETNMGYTGSENFKVGEQFGLFPSVAVGWVPTQYDVVKELVPFISHLKFRGSIGVVGNDRMNGRRFAYRTTTGGTNGSYWGHGGFGENQLGSDNLVWEKAIKYNFGTDIQLFNDKVEATIDVFKDVRSNIYQERAIIPDEVGLINVPMGNMGKMESSGVDGHASYYGKLTKDLSLTVRGNFTFTKNRVTNWEQANIRYPYQSNTGVPYNVLRGLVALGLFKDQADIDSSPKQKSNMTIMPGDIKYQDVNGDGVINNDDEVPLSYSPVPQIQYGFAAEMTWKKFSVSAFFEGTSKANFFYGGAGFYPFVGEKTGNVLSIVAHQNDRWTPASYSGTSATENPNARFPRLSYGNNENNNRASTFWLADASYLRLKNVELAYRYSSNWLKRNVGVSSTTFSLIGTNLAVWDKVKLWDPGQASGNGAVYPLQRTYSFQINVQF